MLTSKDLCEQYGMLIWPEAQILKKCAAMLPEDPVIINIGAGAGTSAVAILEERPDAFIFSVDKETAPLERLNLIKCGIDSKRCVRLLGRSWDIGSVFPFTIHMVFVDGDHGTKAVERDICTWIPHLCPDGIAAFHDYKHPKVPELTGIVDSFMNGSRIIAEYRYIIAFKVNNIGDPWLSLPS